MKKYIFVLLLLALTAEAWGFYAGFEKDEGMRENLTESCVNTVSPVIPGYFASYSFSPAIGGHEGPEKLLDGDTGSKYNTRTDPVTLSFELKSPAVISRYYMVSANDYENRDPASWVLQGSHNGNDWEDLHSVKGFVFQERLQKAEFSFDNHTSYLYYRMYNMRSRSKVPDDFLQLAELAFELPESENKPVEKPGMLTRITGGPAAPWTGNPGKGWTGDKCLNVTGTHTRGRGLCINTLWDNLDIPVVKGTCFEFCILPQWLGEFDFSHANKYVSLDLRFTDGTLLSETGLRDKDGFPMGAWGQGSSKRTFSSQWNYICCDLSPLAGKRIRSILAVYDQRNGAGEGAGFDVYIDDIAIGKRAAVKRETPADYVETTRGTNDSFEYSRGLIYPACVLPNGFTAWTPSTTDGQRRIYAYQPGNQITHFMSGHAVNYCLGDHGNFMVMPNGDIDPAEASASDVDVWHRGSGFDRASETARAHGYTVTLERGNIKAEMAPSHSCGAMRFTFPEGSEQVNIILDSMNAERQAHGRIKFNPDGSFEAFTDQYSDMGGGMPGLYVYGVFSLKPLSCKGFSDSTPLSMVSFPVGTRSVVLMMGTSYISCSQAKKNLQLEIGGASFDTVRNRAKKTWNELLGRVEIDTKGTPENYLVTFYSSMYRLFRFPTTLAENTGTKAAPVLSYASPYASEIDRPSVMEGDMHTSNGFWDNYRTTWPAYALLAPDRDTAALNGILQHYRETGWLAKWLCPRGIDCMLGSSSDVICAEAMVKGIEFDRQTAYECALKNATVVPPAQMGRAGMNFYPYLGHTDGHGFSWMIENSVNDYGISRMAEMLGHKAEAVYFGRTAAFYANMFNPEIEFFVTRNMDGSWKRTGDNFDPFLWHDGYAESNAWGACVSAVHDGEGLAGLYGGRDKLEKRLDDLFAADCHYQTPVLTHENHEARDLRMGQYQHNNQPSQHIPYMYAFTDAKHKTQQLTREILRRLYVGADFGQGYTGDEDNGEQSGWFILSSLGFYALSPASGEYVITSPLFDKAVLKLPTGKILVEAKGNSTDNCYIQKLTVDGKPWNSITISHDRLIRAKHIVFYMGPRPSDWAKGTYPVSITPAGEKPAPWQDVITGIADGQNMQFLYDNNSDTAGEVSTCVFETDKPERAVLLTLCCNDRTKAPREIVLSGSADGSSWTELLRESSPEFMWDRQLRPFLLSRTGYYRYYRLEAKGELAEAELLK